VILNKLIKEVNMKKSFFALASILTISLFAACGGAGTAPSGVGAAVYQEGIEIGDAEYDTQDFPIFYTLPLVSEPTVISFATHENPAGTVSYIDILPAWEEFTRLTGIEIDFQVLPAATYDENILTRLAAGLNLPDVLRLPPNPIQFADSGVIIPIDGLIERYAPNIINLFNDRPEVRVETTAPDGRIYYISSILNARAIVNYQALVYRRDWLEQLGLEEPQTIEDWYIFLSGIRDNDVNGNGIMDDEIPFSATSLNLINLFAWAYGVQLPTGELDAPFSNFQSDENGVVSYVWTDPRLRYWLEEMNFWFESGLFDPDMVGDQPGDQFTGRVTSNLVGASSFFGMIAPQWTTNLNLTYEEAYFDVAPPVRGPWGDRFLLRERSTSTENFAISRDAENPRLVMQMLDFMYAHIDGQVLIGNFGIEGVTFEVVDGRRQFLPIIADDPRGDGAPIAEFGTNGPFPRILMNEVIENRFFHFPQADNARLFAERYQIPSFPNIIPTADESQRITGLLADINTYRAEMMTRFIIGSLSIDEFDSFVNTIEAMGIADLLAIKQAQYDRVMR